MFIVFLVIILTQFHSSCKSYIISSHEDTTEIPQFTTNVTQIFQNHQKSATLTEKTLFRIAVNTNKKISNLKGNIFDKMLSDEMLSIKQQIHEKDSALPSTIQINTISSIPTPTLELQQMWPIESLKSNKEKKQNFEAHMKIIDDTSVDDEGQLKNSNCKANCNESSKVKIVEMRSLSEKLHKKIKTSSTLHHLTRKCPCNTQATKAFRELEMGRSGSDKMLVLKDTPDDSNAHLKCTRTVSTNTPSSYPFYITYSPYFVGTVADFNNVYYHPDVISELKIPKHHKNRKHKKPTTEAADYDDDSEDDSSYEFYDKKPSKHKYTTKSNYNLQIVYEVEQDRASNKDNKEKNIASVSKNKIVEDIVNDLNVYYNDAIIRDCYCSSCSVPTGLQIITFLYLLQWFI